MKFTKQMKITTSISAVLLVGIVILSFAIHATATPKSTSTTVSAGNVSEGNVIEEGVTSENSNADTIASSTTEAIATDMASSDVTSTDANTVSTANTVSENALTISTDVASQSTAATTVTTSESGTPVANHGELAVSGTKMIDKNGNSYQLKGVSTHGINWFPEYVSQATFQTLRDEWGVNCIRLAMYTVDYNGYCAGGDQSALKQLVSDGVSYATNLGLYVIIDWHILNDNNPNTNKAAAIAFFEEMSAKYANYDNVIYEICNEPNGGTTWAQIKSYAMEVIPVIKANNPNAIIVVGTPTWSQDADLAAADPITGYTNIMYTVHFYADTHKDNIRQKMMTAVNAGLAIFCTEFGTCSASGNGSNNLAEANTWIALMDANGISYCIWNLSNKNESSSLIQSSCSAVSGWSEDNLSEEGKWYVGILDHGVPLGSTGSATTPSQSGSGSQATPNTTSATPTVTASAANTQATIAASGSWDSGGGKCYQYTVTIKNTGTSTVSNWNITVTFGSTFTIDQSWNGNYQVSGSSITIQPVDFNNSIAAGQSVEVGFIIQCSGSAGTPTITVN